MFEKVSHILTLFLLVNISINGQYQSYKQIIKRKVNSLYSDLILYSHYKKNVNSSRQTNETIDIETKNISIDFHDVLCDILHLKQLKSMSKNEIRSSTIKYFIEKILIILDEYINNQTNDDLIDKKSNQINFIHQNLTDQFFKNEFNFEKTNLIRNNTRENLSLIINSIISTIEYVEEKNCSIKFQYLNNKYCIKTDFNKTLCNLSRENISKQISYYQENLHTKIFQNETNSKTNEPLIICYYTNWSQYRHGLARFYPENVDINLCTHIIYAFAKLDNDHISPYEWNDESSPWSIGMYQRIINLRKSNKLKILLGLGGWNHGSYPFSNMVHNQTQRTNFIKTTINFLEKYQFDGLDLDWEYPGSRHGSRPTDKQHFTNLLIELKRAFRPFNFLLTAAVGAGKSTIDAAYEIPQSRQNDNKLDKALTQDWSVRYWINNGCSSSKIVMGLAVYGRTFRLASSTKNYIGAPAVGPGNAGLYTNEQGFLVYYEICTRVKQQGWTKIFDEEHKLNYAYKDEQWIGYDDLYSINYKAFLNKHIYSNENYLSVFFNRFNMFKKWV
ncbi:unnamed protein product [Rotaria sp. Silwood2]|nr:unnamed protein product [Rotaria sp. Silwood2]